MTANMRQPTDIGITTGWRLRSSDLERRLTVTAACFILLYIAPAVSTAELLPISSSCIGGECAAAGVGGSNDRSQEVPNVSNHGGNGNTCLTAVCNDTATMILNNMDRSVEPCDNFYRYACGGYLNLTKLSADENSRSSLQNVQRQLDEQLGAILEADIVPNEPRAYRLVKKYYKSCMNEAAIEARGVQPLLASLRRIGGWPMIEGPSWNESNFDWTSAIDELRKSDHHVQVFMNIKGAESVLNHSKNAIYISPPDRVRFDDSFTHVIDNAALAEKVNFILDIAMSLGAQNNSATQKEIKDVLIIALNLETLPTLRKVLIATIAHLKILYPRIPWQEYIYKTLPSTVSISINEVFIIDRPIYFDRLHRLLSNLPKRFIANYIAQTTALESMQYLNREMLKKAQQSSTTVASSRRKMCMKSVSSLSPAIESMYVSRHFSADSKREATSIMDGVRKGVRELLETASWLDKITKSRLLRKSDTMGAYIINADQPSNDTLDKIYESLEIDEEHYYENIHNVSRFNVDYSLRKLRQPNEKLGPSFEVTAAMAAYRRITNTFGALQLNNGNIWRYMAALTPGMLQGDYFGNDRPRFMNYGTIGSAMGHEITHAFDHSGLRYNEQGEEVVEWWEPSSKQEFLIRAQCIVDQYSNYFVREVNLHGLLCHGWPTFPSCYAQQLIVLYAWLFLQINGARTVNENIADIGGIRGAYLAYNDWIAKNGEEPKLPGIDMTPYQLYWISTAARECTKAVPEALLWNVRYDAHSVPEFRIIGAMSNIPEFAKDFKCPVGSNMNPSKKCYLW